MFDQFAALSPVVWGILAALVIAGVILYVLIRDKRRWSVRMMANAALCISLSFILSCIRYKMPQGGSITPASMLPLFLFAYTYGVAPGMLAGMGYGMLQFIQDAYFVHPVQLLLDYPLAFAMLGLAGLAKDRFCGRYGIAWGIALGVLGRFLCAFLSGVIFFGMYAPEGQHVFIYSAIYNGFYLIPEAVICIMLALVPQIQTIARQLALQK